MKSCMINMSIDELENADLRQSQPSVPNHLTVHLRKKEISFVKKTSEGRVAIKLQEEISDA